MAKTHAERQREYRDRVARRLAEEHAEDERRIGVLEAALVRVSVERDDARREAEGLAAEVERLSALACRHPAAAVEGGHCHACGADVD